MFDFVKNLFGGGYEKLVEKQVELDEYEAEIKGSASRGISEPVLSIVKTFSEKGRWKIICKDDPRYNSYPLRSVEFIFYDTKTEEAHRVRSDNIYYMYGMSGVFICVPRTVSKFYMPSWMTEQESIFVVNNIEMYMSKINERFQRIEDKHRRKSEAVSKVNQHKERQRLMSIYYKE